MLEGITRSKGVDPRLNIGRPGVSALLFTALTLFAMQALTGQAAISQVGNVTGISVTTNASTGNRIFTFSLDSGGSANVTPFAPDVVRVDFHWIGPFDVEQPMIDKPFNSWPTVNATLSDLGAAYMIATDELDVEVQKSPFRVHFKDKSGYYLLQDQRMEFDDAYAYTGQRGFGASKLKCVKVMPANQAYFGLGEYGGALNRRGVEIDCWNTGTYQWSETQNPTYLNIPFFYGLQPAGESHPAFVYGLFFNNPCRPLFKFGTQESDQYSFEAGDGRMDYFFFGGGSNHTMSATIDRYTELTGRPTMLPKWGLGYQLSRFSYNSQGWIEYIANEATVTDIPLDAVYMDIDYMDADADGDLSDGQLRQLSINFQFPDPPGMISYCAARGVRVVPLIEPWLQPGDPLHGEADSALHFIKENSGATVTRGIYVGNVSWFDYTSTPMKDWWRDKITNWLGSVNFAGIWNDLNEPEGGDQIPHDALLWCDGRYGTSTTDSRRQWSNERNYFGLRCAEQSYDTMLDKNPNLRPFVLSRSGNAGLHRYAVSWSGDTGANWFYQRATLRFGMGAMIAGASWYGNDVGGFAGSPTDELMVRSTEANCLTPFFRNHCDGVSIDREPWRFSDPYKSMQREQIKFRYRLMPYLYTLAYESTQNGRPMNVPVAFDYYDDVNTHNSSDYEFLVGEYLLSAPVYEEGGSNRTVYLPWPATWYYWPDGTKYGGGQHVNVPAPLGTLPLFMRGGAIVPMGPSMQYANEFQPGYLDINCWPEGESEFTLHEDDGETWDYLGGEYARTRFVSSRTLDAWNFTIEARQGSYDPGTRDFYIYVYNPQSVSYVTRNGSLLDEVPDLGLVTSGWKMTDDGKLSIKVPGNGSREEIRVVWEIAGNYADMTVVGSFLTPAWDPGLTNMTLVNHNTWLFDYAFADATNVQFKFAANGTWDNNWGDNDPAGTNPPLSGIGDAYGSNIVAGGTLDGHYRFIFNDDTLAYSLTDITDRDSVGDGIPDWWRAMHFGGDGTTTNGESCALCDPDFDGMDNLSECIAGTQPTNAASIFTIENVLVVNEGVPRIEWFARPDRIYGVYYLDGLANDQDLVPLGTFTGLVVNADGMTNITDTTAGTATNRFYRVSVQRSP